MDGMQWYLVIQLRLVEWEDLQTSLFKYSPFMCIRLGNKHHSQEEDNVGASHFPKQGGLD